MSCVEAVVFETELVEEEVAVDLDREWSARGFGDVWYATCLRLYENQVDEHDDKVMLDVFVGEALAPWALCETDALAERAVVCFAIRRV
jgi:hypothetical protein